MGAVRVETWRHRKSIGPWRSRGINRRVGRDRDNWTLAAVVRGLGTRGVGVGGAGSRR